MTAAPLAAMLPAVALAGGCLAWLRRAGYGPAAAAMLAALALLQAGFAVAVLRPGHSLWLALAIAAIAASASALAEREDARRVILFGSSLAAIQLCDPMGGLVAVGLLPATLTMARGRSDPRKAAGLYALLLFVPVMTAGLHLYLARVRHTDLSHLLAGSPLFAVPVRMPAQLAFAFAPALVAGPALLGIGRAAGGRAACFVTLAVFFAATVGTWLGAIREPVTLLAAGASLTVSGFAVWPQSRRRAAPLAAALATALSWAVLFWLEPSAAMAFIAGR